MTRPDLIADCTRCAGLCCVAPTFHISADFAINKPAGQPCPHLRLDDRCGIHERLRDKGFPGCAAYDCFGAGQKVTQTTFAGQHWRDSAPVAFRMFAAFQVMRGLHELIWYLTEALTLPAARPVYDELQERLEHSQWLSDGTPDALIELDLDRHRRDCNQLLVRASGLTRVSVRPAGAALRGADLTGKDLRDARLAGADLRGACLIGADLRGADLRLADAIGADLRAADLTAADLSTTIFLSQGQLNAAKGSSSTRLPASLRRPPHWSRP